MSRRRKPPPRHADPTHNHPQTPEPYYEDERTPRAYGSPPVPQSFEDGMNDDVEPCDPFYCQLSASAWPADEKTASACGTLNSAIIQPLNDNEVLPELEVINFESLGVVRCDRCRAYINPYVQVMRGISTWQCNFCHFVNKVSRGYRELLCSDPKGYDVTERRPELSYASFEIVAPSEYMVRAPQAPTYLFVICVNQRAIESGMTALTCETILSCLDDLPGMPRTRIGFLSYHSKLNFYELSGEGRTSTRMNVVGNVDDPYIPLPWQQYIVKIDSAKELITELLRELPNYHIDDRDGGNCFGAAIKVSHKLVNETGGKVLVFNYGLPDCGIAKLADRRSEPHEKQLKRSLDVYLKKSEQFAQTHSAVDIFAFSDGYCDLATMKDICGKSGGDIRLYENFKESDHEYQFEHELRRNLTRKQGWEAVVRVRVSSGFALGDHYGHFHMRARNLVCSPCFHADQSIAIHIKNKNAADKKGGIFNHIYIQTALLYTTSECQRRIRVHTSRMPLVNQPIQITSSIQINPYMITVLRAAMQKVFAQGGEIIAARKHIQNALLGVLSKYTAINGRFLRSEEDYPAQISTWPDVILGALKAVAFRDKDDCCPTADVRIHNFTWLLTCPTDRIDLYLRPSMYIIDELHYEEGLDYGLYDEDGIIILPPEATLSKQSLEPNRILLVDNGLELIMWVGAECPPEILEPLFNTSVVLDVMHLNPPAENEPETSICNRVQNILFHCRSSCVYQNLKVVGESSQYDKDVFRPFLYEERTASVMGRDEFLNFLGESTRPQRG